MGKRPRAVESVEIVDGLAKFYRGKRVFVTGHTGFKGMWLCKMLERFGAKITGYALPPRGETAKVFASSGIEAAIVSVTGDVRDLAALQRAFDAAAPEIVFHLAAQPIVREGYRDPVGTYGTNVMGTVHLLDCMRQNVGVKSAVIVTTDKVYANNEWCWGYRETDTLGGADPYSNSKSCAELVTQSYKQSFFAAKNIAVSTVRAGNVIGGGDFAPNRIIPDCIRAAYAGKSVLIRNPHSVRPYQHVLEPLSAYLQIAAAQYDDESLADCYNIGPAASDCVETGELADMFCRAWGEGLTWEVAQEETAAKEANFLRLDCNKISAVFGIKPRLNIRQAVEKTVAWAKAYRDGQTAGAIMQRQIEKFEEMCSTLPPAS